MNHKNISMRLLLIQLFFLVLNLFISFSRMLFLPWFVEDSFGLLGIFITTPLLLFIRVTMTYLKKRKGLCIIRTRQTIPFSYHGFIKIKIEIQKTRKAGILPTFLVYYFIHFTNKNFVLEILKNLRLISMGPS
ncbi:hypothetical protein ACOSJ1_EBGNOMHC_05291 [Bacillus mycoides KBAB4]|nr:hypothetical protein ACOSJ1_EBGNOMHC_05291 [Bacillus mycoides KBAB4]